jgi:hypothetical protein
MNEKESKSADTLKTENHKRIESHKATAAHHENAAKYHQEAVEHHEAGNHDKAAQSTIIAHGHAALANEIQREETKRHAGNTHASELKR